MSDASEATTEVKPVQSSPEEPKPPELKVVSPLEFLKTQAVAIETYPLTDSYGVQEFLRMLNQQLPSGTDPAIRERLAEIQERAKRVNEGIKRIYDMTLAYSKNPKAPIKVSQLFKSQGDMLELDLPPKQPLKRKPTKEAA